MISSDPLSLYHHAQQAVTIPEQAEMLEAIAHDNDRDLNHVLWGEVDHGKLMGGEFGALILALAVSMGSKHIWRELKEFGYDANSELYVKDHFGEQSEIEKSWGKWTLGGWACAELDDERVETLIHWGWLKPFVHDGHSNIPGIKAGTLGIAYGDNAVCDRMLDLYQQKLKYNQGTNQTGGKGVDTTYDMICGLTLNASALDVGDAGVTDAYRHEMERRLECLNAKVVECFYGHTTPEMLWSNFLATPVRAGYSSLRALANYVLAQCADVDRWAGDEALQLLQHKDLSLWQALVDDMPFDVLWAHKDKLCQEMQQPPKNDLLGDVWNSLVGQVKRHDPQLFQGIPKEYRSGGDVHKAIRTKQGRDAFNTWVSVWEHGARAPKTGKKKM